MRKQLLSVFLTLLLGLTASAAEGPSVPAAGQRNELQRVNVVRGADEIRVEMSARGAVTVTVEVDGSHERSEAGTGRPSTDALRGALALRNLTVQVRCLT